MKNNNKRRFSRGRRVFQRHVISPKHIARFNASSNPILEEQCIIRTLSNEDRVNLFQRIEEIQGLRHSLSSSTTLPDAAEGIVRRCQMLPVYKRKKYAESVKKALYYYVMQSINE